jgi:histidinol-phosphatase
MAGRCWSSTANCSVAPNRRHPPVADAAAVIAAALPVAQAAARAAAEQILPYYRRAGVDVERKADASPVTEADRAAERAIRAHIGAAFPGHAIWGEEYGGNATLDGWLWLVDPLDGTKSFVRGNPVFSTQIALWHDGVPMLGVSHCPVSGESAWATRGGGAFVDGERVRCLATSRIEDAAISTGNLKRLAAGASWPALAGLIGRAWRIRGYGDYLHYHLLARGGVDAVIESDVHVLDIAALCLIVEEAGGCFTDLAGRAVSLGSTSVLAAATPELHGSLLRELAFVSP